MEPDISHIGQLSETPPDQPDRSLAFCKRCEHFQRYMDFCNSETMLMEKNTNDSILFPGTAFRLYSLRKVWNGICSKRCPFFLERQLIEWSIAPFTVGKEWSGK